MRIRNAVIQRIGILALCLVSVHVHAWVHPLIEFSSTSSWIDSKRCILQSTSIVSTPAHYNDRALATRRFYGQGRGESDDSDAMITETRMGLNELHTLLRSAVAEQNFVQAGRISDILLTRLYGDDLTIDEKKQRRRSISWKGLGAAPWLVERLDLLNLTFPTTIQINAMEAVNAILTSTPNANATTSKMPTALLSQGDGKGANLASLEERIGQLNLDLGVVVSGATGSGKTLAYCVPLLSTLSDSLFKRQQIRVGNEEMVGDITGDLVDRIAVVTSPVVRSNSRKQTRQNGPIATGASLATLGQSGKDVTSPLALIVVPTRELGVQTALRIYQLVGGNIKDSETETSGNANMFRYKGPKGVRIGCVLDDEEASMGLKLQTDIAITTPQYIGKLIDDGDVQPSKLRVIVYDEADLGLEQTGSKVLTNLFDDRLEDREYTRLTLLVGASVTEALGNFAVSSRILPVGKSYIATATRFGELAADTVAPASITNSSAVDAPRTASLKDLNVCLYPGLKHQRAIVHGRSGLLVLTRLLRKELQKYDAAKLAPQKEDGIESASAPVNRPRVVVFFPDEASARAAIVPLRDALWGEHKLCVLLPKTGERPLNIMDQFKKNETSVMLATPNSVRGLDFPSVSHVYTLYLPIDDPREYVHLAGRVGRVGQQGCVLGDGGNVISILNPDEATKMEILAATLGFDFADIDMTEFNQSDLLLDDATSDNTDHDDIEKLRRLLEDTITLVDLADDPTYNPTASEVSTAEKYIDKSDDDDDDEEFDERDDYTDEDFQ